MVVPAPDDPSDRVVAVLKSNLGDLPAPLTFRVEATPERVPRLAWAGPAPYAHAALLTDSRGSKELPEGALGGALAFLGLTLMTGPQPAHEVLRLAQEAGIARRTLRRARLQAGVVAEKAGFQGRWVWRLLPPGR